MARDGSVVDILRILDAKDLNLQMAGGRDLDKGGEFVFSVHHGAEPDDGPNNEAAQLLRDDGFKAEVFPVEPCIVPDTKGALLKCIEERAEREGPAYEIFVGTQGEYDGIPVQVIRREDVGGRAKA